MANKTKGKNELGAPEWNLSDLYGGVDDPRIKHDLNSVLDEAIFFETRYKSTLKNSEPSYLLAAFMDLEEILVMLSRLGGYTGLLTKSDTANERYKELDDLVEKISTEARSHLLFFDLEIFELDEEELNRFIDSHKLNDFRHYLEKLKKRKPYHLSLPEEKILNEKRRTSFQALTALFQNFVSLMEFEMRVSGKKRKLSATETIHFFQHPDRGLRKNAADALSQGLSLHGWFFTDIINYLASDRAIEDKLRAHQYPEEDRHLSNEISKKAVDALAGVSAEHHHLAERYYALKRRVLGLSELFDYDRYAPIEVLHRVLNYGEAKKIVLCGYNQFSSELGKIVQEFYDRNWIDAKVRKGKRGGAFCSYPSPDLHPYVFTNFQGSPRDVATEAHELGHAVHGTLARNNHYLDYNTPLTMAETASVFGEMLIFESLKNAADGKEKLALVMQKIEDIISTVFRQIAMFRFEQRLHYTFRESGRVSQEMLNSWWNEEHQKVFGKSLILRPEHGCFWMYVSHIFSWPFYVYAYAFGELLTLSLYARYKAGEENFVEKYIKLLSAGGSRSPDDLLSEFGIDSKNPDFWKSGMTVLENLISEAEELANTVIKPA